jgi:hypothetical protein
VFQIGNCGAFAASSHSILKKEPTNVDEALADRRERHKILHLSRNLVNIVANRNQERLAVSELHAIHGFANSAYISGE